MTGLALAATLVCTGILHDNPVTVYPFHHPETSRSIQDVSIEEGYRDIISYGDIFIAVGTGGKIDRITGNGEYVSSGNTIVNVSLNEAVADGRSVFVAGDNGTILFSEDGELYKILQTGTGSDFNSLILFNGFLIASADSGILFLSNDGTAWHRLILQLKGNVVSLSAEGSECAGVTDAGEIILSDDGLNWEIFDYNETYRGFAKPCRFKKVLVAGKRIAVAGVHDDGTPAVLFSTMGKVWTERLLHYTDMNGQNGFLESLPNDIAYDPAEDQFLVACNKGEVISLPPCTKCNMVFRFGSADLHAAACSGNIVAVGGSGFFFGKAVIR